MSRSNSFDPGLALERCRRHRRRVLEVSLRVQALHIATAFSCTEIVDAVYHGLKRSAADTFLMSKGHGAIMQYVVLEDLGVLPRAELDRYCTSAGILGAHPDCGNPGIVASTGSLGHGLPMALGLARAERITGGGGTVYCLLGDGELHEGSTWEAVLLAPSLGASNLVVFLDSNGWQSCSERTADLHPALYPLAPKFLSFGWETVTVDGHDGPALVEAVLGRAGGKPLMVVCDTVKGKGVSFMEDSVAWHYKTPKPAEFDAALAELSS